MPVGVVMHRFLAACILAHQSTDAFLLPFAYLSRWRSSSVAATVEKTNAHVEASVEEGFVRWWDDADDEISATKCRVEGILPTWLKGRLVRNGPGKWVAGDGGRAYQHAFDGLAKLVSFDLTTDDVPVFSTKFLRSNMYNKTIKGTMPASVTTGPVKPDWTLTEGIVAALTGPQFDNTPVNIHRLGKSNRWVATTDAPPLVEFNPINLSTKGRVDTTADPIVGQTQNLPSLPALPGLELFSTAHPQRHPHTDETLNYFLELRPIGGPVAHMVASSSRNTGDGISRRLIGSVEDLESIPYVHSFGVSQHYVVLALYPLSVPFGKLVNGKGFLKQLEWHPEDGTKLVVWDLRENEKQIPTIFRAPACFAYHVINTYEEDDENVLVMDVNGYSDPAIANSEHGFAYLANMRSKEQRYKQVRDGNYLRFRMNMNDDVEDSSPTPMRKAEVAYLDANMRDSCNRRWTYELVRINDAFAGKKHQYSYGLTGFAGNDEKLYGPGGAIVKVDVGEGGENNVKTWRSSIIHPGEPVFVATPTAEGGSGEEDDGVVLFIGYDCTTQESSMFVLDARDMSEMARIYSGARIPVLFHGQWLPAEQ